MAISDSLARQLAVLSDALDEPGADLQAIIAVLTDDLAAAVESFLGFRLTMALAGSAMVLTVIDGATPHSARSSLRLPLRVPASAALGHIVLYAHRARAFDGLAVDAQRVHQRAGDVLVDHDLHEDLGSPGITGLSEQSDINQAIGVLLDGGHDPTSARAELERRAHQSQTSVAESARALLAAIPTGGPR